MCSKKPSAFRCKTNAGRVLFFVDETPAQHTNADPASGSSIRDTGEFGLIDRFAALLPPLASNSPVLLGIGDDAAVLAPTGVAGQTVVTCDLLLEDRHFRRAWCDPYRLGRKAVAVNLSDIAAMGAVPTATFVALALPSELPLAFADALFQGMRDIATEYGSVIAGGDTNASPDRIVLSITQMGRANAGRLCRRDGAKTGDLVVTSGPLGGAAAGLALLDAFGLSEAEARNVAAVNAQLSPTPRVRAGQQAASVGVSAMMDISDGLLADLTKLCRASRVGAVVREADVPAHSAVPAAVDLLFPNGTEAPSVHAARFVFTGGEDYELLATIAPNRADVLKQVWHEAGCAMTIVGEIVAGSGVQVERMDGTRIAVRGGGWDHFQSVKEMSHVG